MLYRRQTAGCVIAWCFLLDKIEGFGEMPQNNELIIIRRYKMDYIFEKVKDSVYALAVWDATWNSYNNCYIVLEENGVTLVDSGKAVHSDLLLDALRSLGKTADDVKLFIATHGHEDHIQGAAHFPHAQKYIHIHEADSINETDSPQFTMISGDNGMIGSFRYDLVGHHSPGSILLFHESSNVLFSGDFLCYFGDPLSSEGFVSGGTDLRKAWTDFLSDGGIPADELPLFLNGLRHRRILIPKRFVQGMEEFSLDKYLPSSMS